MPLLIRKLRDQPNPDKISVAFPDEGAYKRFNADLSEWPSITCIKIRNGDKRVVTIKDGTHYLYQIVIMVSGVCKIVHQNSSLKTQNHVLLNNRSNRINVLPLCCVRVDIQCECSHPFWLVNVKHP